MSESSVNLRPVQERIAAGDLAGALELCGALAAGAPMDAHAASLEAYLRLQTGDTAGAIEAAQRACALRPGDAGFLVNLARAQMFAGDHDACLATFDKAQAAKPGWSEPSTAAAEACIEHGWYYAALSRCRAAMERFPSDLHLVWTCTRALHFMGRNQEAVDMMRGLLARYPADPHVPSSIAHYLNYVPGATPEQLFEAHRAFGRMLARHHPVPPRPASAALDAGPPNRRLRVGLISPDFREHSVAFFVAPIFEHYNRDAIELFGYFTKRVGDNLTTRFSSQADHWAGFAKITPDDLAKRIGQDNLDLLIDLAGHTRGHSLLAMRTRPAQFQATYLGYPNTTGLSAINFRLVDSLTDPPGMTDKFNVEKLIRLDPCFICFNAPKDQAPPAPPPSVANGYITFGSFNTLKKLNTPLIELWAKVLTAVPGSRMMLKGKGLGEPAMREDIAARFAACGIPADRLELVGPIKEQGAHRDAYARIDIALDTFPYHGTTTTCEALWMGVPVVTLAGNMHAGRVGISLLTNVGLTDLIAPNEQEYVRIAAALVADTARLGTLRREIRGVMAGSPLCDGIGFCRRFEEAARQMMA